MHYPLKHHPFSQLITLVIIMLLSVILFSFIGLLVAIPLFDLSLSQVFQDFNTDSINNNLMLFKYLQSLQTIGLFVLPPFVFAWLYSRSPVNYLKAGIFPDSGTVFFTGILIFAAIPFIGYLGELNQSIEFPESLKSLESWFIRKESNARELTHKFLTARSPAGLMWNIIMIGVLPAIGEEFVFRGVLQKILHQWTKNIHWAIFISAFAFSVMHVQFYGLVPRFFLGILFGYLLVWSGTIWLPVLAHFMNNTIAVVYYYLLQQKGAFNPDQLSEYDMPMTLIILSLAGIVFLCYLIIMNEKKLGKK